MFLLIEKRDPYVNTYVVLNIWIYSHDPIWTPIAEDPRQTHLLSQWILLHTWSDMEPIPLCMRLRHQKDMFVYFMLIGFDLQLLYW